MHTEQVSQLLTGRGLVRGKQEERVEAMALLVMCLLFEQGFQFIRALADDRSLTMHRDLLG